MKKLLLSFVICIFASGLSAQTFPFVEINQINFVDSLTLANCSDSSTYLGDTIRTRGIVVTDGNLSEVSSGSITGGSRPFITLVDTADNGSPGPWKGIVVMGVAAGTSDPIADVENAVAGDIMDITAVVGSFGGLIQLQPLNSTSVTLSGFTNAPTFKTISAGEIQDQQGRNVLPTGEQWQGSYIELKNMTVTSVSVFSSGSRTEFTVQDSAGNQVLVADRFLPMVVDGISTVNPNSPDSVGRFIAPPVGAVFRHIRGVIFQDENGCAGGGSFAGGYEINPVYDTDMERAASPPTITNVERNILIPNDTQSVTVSADIFDSDGTITSATLFYTTDPLATSNLFTSTSMSNISGTQYTASIPAFPLDSMVRYFIEATDDSNKTSTNPITATGAALNSFFYTVRPNGPTIMDVQMVPDFATSDASPLSGETITVTGFATATLQTGGLGFLYIQDTSVNEFSGIYIQGGPTSVFNINRGQEVTVTGRVQENFGFTRISADSVFTTGQSATVTPIVLDLGDTAIFGSNSDELEKYESMLIRYENANPSGMVNVVNPDLGFGEYSVGAGKNASLTARVLAGRQDEGTAQGSLDVSYISDTAQFGGALNVTPIQVDTNFAMDYIQGILYYAFGNYKLTPRNNNDFFNLIVSLEEIERSEVNTSIFPNPTSDRLNIQIDPEYSFTQLNIRIFDMSGRVVLESRTSNAFNSLNLEGMERGVYILQIQNQEEVLNTSKLILE